MLSPVTRFFWKVKCLLIPYVFPVGIILNLTLLVLIVKKTTIKDYQKVFLLTCTFEIAFSVNNLFFVVTSNVENGLYVAVIEGIAGHLSPSWTYFGSFVMVWFLYIGVTNNAAVFVYRYFSVCRNVNFSTLSFMVLVCLGWFVALIYMGFVVFTYLNEPENQTAYKALNGTEFPSDGSFTNFISISLPRLIPLAVFGGLPIMTVSYTIIVCTSIAVFRKLNKLKAFMSSEQKKFHTEVTIVLFMEALIPFLTGALPAYIDVSKLVFPNLPTEWFAEFGWCLTLLGPSMTAIVKILYIKTFRKTLLQLLFPSSGKENSRLFTVSRGIVTTTVQIK